MRGDTVKMVEEAPSIRFYMFMVRHSLRSTVRQIWVRLLAALGIFAAIAVAWWMKVEDARVPDAPPQVAFGEPVNVGRAILVPYKLTIENAAPSATGSQRKLVLTGQLESVTGSSQVSIFGSPEKLPALSSGGMTFPAPKVYLVRDKEPLKQLHPRIRELVSIVWDIPEGWTEQDVTIGFSTQQFKLKDNLYAKASWLQFHPSGTLSARPERGA
ncbi:hypothetical protein ACFWXH_22385 [Mesorhizobium sp. NPDC059054]|uniref:hypothetical protein n=1 Tax=Mesorhizobium sp. NPDC059054 TaxID=3346711 RepID=UPI003681D66E